MKLIICANDADVEALASAAENVTWIRVTDPSCFASETEADAYFNLLPNAAAAAYDGLQKPVFIGSVADTHLSTPFVIRINGWNGFLEKKYWEMAGAVEEDALAVLDQLQKIPIITQNTAGFISARTIAMIVNEAFFALGDAICTANDIDTAMKLGTNYPMGPFEWGQKIGLAPIYELLQSLASTDPRYQCAPSLQQIAQKS
jgi:3-hydroxybutyryl-CoA dehydrogenase